MNSGRSQTLDRGVHLLELLAAATGPATVAQLAERSGLHRSVVYRLLRTLEDHRLVARHAGDQFGLGVGLAILARGLTSDLRELVIDDLTALAETTGLACFFAIREGAEVVALVVAEPTGPDALFVQRVGFRHPLDRGAPGHAVRMVLDTPPLDEADADRLAGFRERGWAYSHSEVIDGVHSIAAPVGGLAQPAIVAVNYVGERDVAGLAQALLTTARALTLRLGGTPA